MTIGGGACPGDCNREWRAGVDGVSPVDGAPTWCYSCSERLRDDMARMPELASRLVPGRTARRARGETGDGGARALSHSPSLSPAWDDADALIRWAVALEDRLAAQVGFTPHGKPLSGGGQRRSLGTAVATVVSWWSVVMAWPDADRVGAEIRGWCRRLTVATGSDRLVHRIPGRCTVCDRAGMLRRRDGDELVQCGACGASWNWERYQIMVRAIVEHERGRGRR